MATTSSAPSKASCHDLVGELLQQVPSGTLIADVPYFMHGRWERAAARAARDIALRGARAARDIALRATAAGLTVVPLHASLQRLGWKAMATHFAADWFHRSNRGHHVWADAFWAA